MLTEREVILLKVESTYNTDPVPTAALDAILVRSPSWAHEGARMADRPVVRSTLDTARKIYGGALMSISFEAEIKGSGTIDVAPEIGQALRACGMDQTINAATSVVYQPVSAALESCTIYYYQDGKLKKLTGCVGTVVYTFEAGGLAIAAFTFTGHIGAETDTAIVSPTFDATEPVSLKGLSMQINSVAHSIQTLTLDVANNVSYPADINAADGFGQIRITKRDVNGSVNPEDTLLATSDYIADWKADTERAIDTGVIGSVAGNRFQLSIPKAGFRDISQGDREGVRTLELSFGAGITTGDDEFTLTFT